MKRIVICTVALLLACSAGQAEWLDGWSYRQKITVPDAKVTGTLTDYPVLLNLTGRGLAGKANWDRSDVRFTADDGTTLLDYHLIREPYPASTDRSVACWSWFSRPIIIYSSAYDKTWVGYVNNDGNQAIAEWDHVTHKRTDTIISTSTTQKDDHNPPAIFVRSDGKILACWGQHNGAGLYFAISSEAGVSTAWGSTTTLTPAGEENYTYAQLQYLSEEGETGRLYWFFRAGMSLWRYIYSDDQGSTWTETSATIIDDESYPYLVSTSNGVDEIHLFVSSNHPNSGAQKLYHLYYDGAWKKSDGTPAGTAPYNSTEGTLVHDASAGSDTVWVSDITLDGDGNPHVLYYVYPENAPSNQDLYYGKWTGSAWATVKVCDEGGGIDTSDELYYPGVASFDPDDTTTVYVSKSEADSIYEIQKWTTANAGATWAKSSDITTGSASHNARPVMARGHGANSDVNLFWWSGVYGSFITYATKITSEPWNVHDAVNLDYARVQVPSLGGEDIDIYMYYGNASAVDAQDRSGTWDGVTGLQAVHHIFGPSGLKVWDDSGGTNHATISTNGGAWDETYTFPGYYLNKTASTSTGIAISGIDLASQQAVTCMTIASWEAAIDTNECSLWDDWSTTKAGIMFRIEPADNSIEAFVRRVDNTQEGGKVGAFNVAKNTLHQFVFEFDYDASDNNDIIIRQNAVEATYACSAATALDADASASLTVGHAVTATNDKLKGIVSMQLVALSLLSKNWTDTHYANVTDAEFVTYGDEEDAPAAGGGKGGIIGGGILEWRPGESWPVAMR
jgi:hypothetical protein